MDEKLDEALCRDFPNLYADRHLDCTQTCMSWGFETGNGWEPLIRELSEKLEKLIVEWKTKNPEEAKEFWPRAIQVKEKYGTLRFYMTSSTDEMEKLISEAEDKSAITCEECGEPGELHGTAWLSTTCLEHTKKDTLAAEVRYYKQAYKETYKELEEALFNNEVDETLSDEEKGK